MSNLQMPLSRQDFQQKLLNIKGAKMCTIVTSTAPTMRKTNNPYHGSVQKVTKINVTLNFIYANSVNNQRVKEGNEPDFEPVPRKWGVRIPKTSLIEHKGKIYVEAKPNGKPQSVDYFFNGEKISKSLLEPFMNENNSNAERQGVEKEVIVRDYALENIIEWFVDGYHYYIN